MLKLSKTWLAITLVGLTIHSGFTGTEGGNGGDPVEQEVATQAKAAFFYLDKHSNQFPDVDLERIWEAMENIKFQIVHEQLYDQHGNPKVLINFPKTKSRPYNLIQIYKEGWQSIQEDIQKQALAGHEFLFLTGSEGDAYEVTSSLYGLNDSSMVMPQKKVDSEILKGKKDPRLSLKFEITYEATNRSSFCRIHKIREDHGIVGVTNEPKKIKTTMIIPEGSSDFVLINEVKGNTFCKYQAKDIVFLTIVPSLDQSAKFPEHGFTLVSDSPEKSYEPSECRLFKRGTNKLTCPWQMSKKNFDLKLRLDMNPRPESPPRDVEIINAHYVSGLFVSYFIDGNPYPREELLTPITSGEDIIGESVDGLIKCTKDKSNFDSWSGYNCKLTVGIHQYELTGTRATSIGDMIQKHKSESDKWTGQATFHYDHHWDHGVRYWISDVK